MVFCENSSSMMIFCVDTLGTRQRTKLVRHPTTTTWPVHGCWTLKIPLMLALGLSTRHRNPWIWLLVHPMSSSITLGRLSTKNLQFSWLVRMNEHDDRLFLTDHLTSETIRSLTFIIPQGFNVQDGFPTSFQTVASAVATARKMAVVVAVCWPIPVVAVLIATK